MLRLHDEDQLMDESFRKAVLADVQGEENQERKRRMKVRYDIIKDQTKKYVQEQIRLEQGEQVLKEIIHRTSNISIAKKIIEKKAQVYNHGIERTTEIDDDQQALDNLMDLTNANSKMKKANRYSELFKNSIVQVLPVLNKVTGKYRVKYFPTPAFLIDAIEDADDPETARVYIFSYWNPNAYNSPNAEAADGFRSGDGATLTSGDGVNQIIADSPDDESAGRTEYVWWSHKFHFTTDQKGTIIGERSPEDLINPIQKLPFHNFSMDQDGHFWAEGGDDIIDGSILINLLLSDLYYIAKFQGMGIFYMFGNGVPKTIRVGPAEVLTLNMEPGDPEPKIGFASSNPPLQDHMAYIEQYIAMLLSTNNLEAGTINGKLSANNATSGVHEMVNKSENMSDIKDQQQIYIDGEKDMINTLILWINYYNDKKLLEDDYAAIGSLDPDMEVNIKFMEPAPFMTEKERLEVIGQRKDLGLDSMLDSIKRDNPDMTEDQAKEKLLQVLKDRVEESNRQMMRFNNGEESVEDDGDDPDSNGDKEQAGNEKEDR